MKKLVLTATFFLATATAADAEWVQCETIRIIPGFSIERCTGAPPHGGSYHVREYVKRWGHNVPGHRKHFSARGHGHAKWYFKSRQRHLHQDRHRHGRYHRRDFSRWR